MVKQKRLGSASGKGSEMGSELRQALGMASGMRLKQRKKLGTLSGMCYGLRKKVPKGPWLADTASTCSAMQCSQAAAKQRPLLFSTQLQKSWLTQASLQPKPVCVWPGTRGVGWGGRGGGYRAVTHCCYTTGRNG